MPKHRSTYHPDTRLRLARAISGGERAILIESDNRGEKWVPLADAVRSGRAYAVAVRSEILAWDFDDPGDAVDRVVGLERRLRGYGLESVRVASGRRGHLHVFARVPDAALRREIRRWSELPKPCKTIRPPGSPHRLGGASRLLAPASPALATAALRPRVAPGVASAPMPAWARRLAETGDLPGRYPSRSERDLAIAAAIAARGIWDSQRAYDWLRRLPAGDRLRELEQQRGEQAARAYWDRTWKRAQETRRPRRPTGAGARLRAAARAYPAGRAADTRRAVLWALAEALDSSGRDAVRMSSRQIAEAAGHSQSTCARAVRDLLERGHVRRVGRRGLGPGPAAPRASGRDTISDTVNAIIRSHDAWRSPGGLGRAARATYLALRSEPMTAPELAGVRGVSSRAVRQALATLKRHGLVESERSGRYRLAGGDPQAQIALLDAAAVRRGVRYRGLEQRAQHDADRHEREPRLSLLEEGDGDGMQLGGTVGEARPRPLSPARGRQTKSARDDGTRGPRRLIATDGGG